MFDKKDNLKPCPACGATTVYVSDMNRLAYTEHLDSDEQDRLYNEYCVRCEDGSGGGCGCMTPPFSSPQEAIDYWEDSPMLIDKVTIEGGINALKKLSEMR